MKKNQILYSIGLSRNFFCLLLINLSLSLSIFLLLNSFALILTVGKIFISMHQLEIAKTLNNELSPVSDVYKIHAIQQLIKPAPKPTGKNGAAESAKVAAARDVEAIPLKPMQKKNNGQPAKPVSVPVKIEKEVQETQKPSSVVQVPVEQVQESSAQQNKTVEPVNTANSPAILVESSAPVSQPTEQNSEQTQ